MLTLLLAPAIALAPSVDDRPLPDPQTTATPQPPPLGGTVEVGIGFGQWRSGSDSISGFAPSLGFGRFVSPRVAITFRAAGVAIASGAFGYIGTLGPHAQLWLGDHGFLGLGFGAAVGGVVGPFGGGGDVTVGADARLGYAFRGRGQSGANAALEVTTFQDIATVGLVLGYQSF